MQVIRFGSSIDAGGDAAPRLPQPIAAKNKERRAAERAYVNELFEEFLAKRRVRVCSICLDKPLTHAVMPCGHKCMCGDCADKLTSKVCPICKDEYITIGQIYEC